MRPGDHRQESNIDPNADKPPHEMGPVRMMIATIAVVAAGVTAVLAWATNAIGSGNELGSHETPLLVAQLVVAVIGLIAAGLFARALSLRADRLAAAWLIAGLLLFLVWGVLNDAAVHGWANLKVF